ncbi:MULTISPECIES: amino acid ABC transporter permease [Variovorax]|jgi:His/Glu/Gln/Arg/opine family amino acid ABC transporter permease subunit|uniref:His/Glu/Gln/Arg/opine family amino acid ABC transporter permease subunit n=1 Tax=Variovorax paradoxus TaxID=34073 RepID=A0AAE4BXG1_VARPD|nr:amino acid ABC transporter permease [Variovorax paradoxus]MDR6428026.1 His/Glu/Gln/Arg/opine family amino acid ABC transporter permease subunit [Variovorax paradoxus]
MGNDNRLDWAVIKANLPSFEQAVVIDLYIAAMGFVVACVLGLMIAAMRSSSARAVRAPAYAFTQIIRGIPLYVLILWVYFGLSSAAGVNLSPVLAMVISIGVFASTTTAEIFRAAFAAIDPGQVEAARATGLRRSQIYRHVLLPVAMRVAIPPLGNVVILQVKSATYGAVIAVPGMVYLAQDLSMTQFRPFEAYATVAALLLMIVLALSFIVMGLERVLKLP